MLILKSRRRRQDMFNFFKKNQEDKIKKSESMNDELLEKGLQYFNNNNMNEAQAVFEDILLKDSKNKKAQIYLLKIYNHFVKIYSKSGDTEKMNDYFNKLDELRNASRKGI